MKQIRLNAFDMNCIGHIQQGLWTHPRDQSPNYKSLAHWTTLAKRLEAGLFDGIFLADILGVYDVFGQSPQAAIRHAVQIPVNDPMMLVPAMAAATTHLGFGVTANLSYEPPYLFARRISTLDHLTQGRIGWNVVTGYLDSAARAMGHPHQVAHDDRYDIADDTMQALYKLWEGSWADDAVKADRASGLYADPTRIRAVTHHSPHIRLNGIHLSEPSPQRTPVLYQAGSSPRGQRFAGQHAECVFLNGGPKPTVAAHVAAIRQAAIEAGRAPTDILTFVGISVVTAETEALAQAKLADYRRHASPEAALVHASASMGIDLEAYGMDQPIEAVPTQAIASNLAAMAQQGMTKRKLLDRMVLGSRQIPIVGTPAQVADALLAWVDEAGVDGFILSRTVTPECFDDVIDLVIPELQSRGAYKTAYAPGTLRQKLFGHDRLPATHPAAAERWWANDAPPTPNRPNPRHRTPNPASTSTYSPTTPVATPPNPRPPPARRSARSPHRMRHQVQQPRPSQRRPRQGRRPQQLPRRRLRLRLMAITPARRPPARRPPARRCGRKKMDRRRDEHVRSPCPGRWVPPSTPSGADFRMGPMRPQPHTTP